MFSVFQRAYSNCIDLKKHSRLVEVNEKTVMHFVVNAFCRDVVARVFRAQINAKGSQWTYAFIDGFMTFLTNYVEPELSQELFRAYQKLALSFGGSLTPITILNSQDVVKVCNKTFVRMQDSLDDGQLLKCLKLTVNEGIARSPNLNGPLKGELNEISILAFAKRVIVPSDSNPFRSIVLNG